VNGNEHEQAAQGESHAPTILSVLALGLEAAAIQAPANRMKRNPNSARRTPVWRVNARTNVIIRILAHDRRQKINSVSARRGCERDPGGNES
jgi:hypothetical protein